MITHKYRTIEVPVAGGQLHVGIWDPIGGAAQQDVLVIHGVTSSHLAWPFVVSQLPGTRVIAPDLRGRGSSHGLEGAAGMRAHAVDLVATLDALQIASLPVVGHSMGGFVAAVLAHLAPERVDRIVLVDGGLPLDAPTSLAPEQLVQAILGPTAERLSMTFATVEDYLDFWRVHPAFASVWTPEVETYFAYDLVPTEGGFRAATSLQVTTEDTIDMNTGEALPKALQALAAIDKPVAFVSVPRGLRDETPGLYARDYLERLLPLYPAVRHVPLGDHNHYTIVMSEQGAADLGAVLRKELRAELV